MRNDFDHYLVKFLEKIRNRLVIFQKNKEQKSSDIGEKHTFPLQNGSFYILFSSWEWEWFEIKIIYLFGRKIPLLDAKIYDYPWKLLEN